MAGKYRIEVLSKTPFQDIRGESYCVWCYRLSWTGHPDKLESRVGLVFSSKIDIKDPKVYPDLQTIQGTEVAKDEGDDKQYVFRDIDPSSITHVDFCFLAP